MEMYILIQKVIDREKRRLIVELGGASMSDVLSVGTSSSWVSALIINKLMQQVL